LLERVVAVIVLGMPELRGMLANWSDATAAAPLSPPALLRDERLPPIVRANLALWFAREMVQRRLHQEALDALLPVRAEQVVDPAAYYFFRAVSENKLRKRDEALASINRLLSSVEGVPDRYRFVAELLRKDMDGWKEKDLGDIARRMQEIEGRLQNHRGGPQTQERQKEVIAMLDQLIKDLEDQCNQCQCNGGAAGGARVTTPMQDSRIVGGQAGKGEVDKKPLIKDEKVWGKMPEKEKVKALENVNRELPPRFKDAIEAYTKRMAGGNNAPPREEE
jgi:tetratricopeptide (TPR) repeat protein